MLNLSGLRRAGKRPVKWLIILLLVCALPGTVLSLAILPIEADDNGFLQQAKLWSRHKVMLGLSLIEQMKGESTAYTVLDENFRYADLNHPGFRIIRDDPRIKHLYGAQQAADLEQVLEMSAFLQGHFRDKGPARQVITQWVTEVLNWESGLNCGGYATLLSQMIQAGGTQARKIWTANLQGDQTHAVTEFWSQKYRKWILVDAFYDVHYRDQHETPLSSGEIYRMAQQKHGVQNIRICAGNREDGRAKSAEIVLKTAYPIGFGVQFYNRWIDLNLPRRKPARSPVLMTCYYGKSRLADDYFHNYYESFSRQDSSLIFSDPSQFYQPVTGVEKR